METETKHKAVKFLAWFILILVVFSIIGWYFYKLNNELRKMKEEKYKKEQTILIKKQDSIEKEVSVLQDTLIKSSEEVVIKADELVKPLKNEKKQIPDATYDSMANYVKQYGTRR